MKIKRRILSGLCAVSLALGMSTTKSDAKIISYVADVCWGSSLNLGCLIAVDAQCLQNFEWKDFKEQKVLSSFLVITNVLGLADYFNRMVDAKYVQNLEAELQKLKNPDKKLNEQKKEIENGEDLKDSKAELQKFKNLDRKSNEQKKTDDKNEKLNVPTNDEKKG